MLVSGFTVSSSPMVYATFRLVTRVFKEKHSRFSVYHRLKTMRLMPLSHNNNNNSNTRDWIDRNSPMPTYRLIKILSRSISPKSSQTRNTHATHTLNIYIYIPTHIHTYTHRNTYAYTRSVTSVHRTRARIRIHTCTCYSSMSEADERRRDETDEDRSHLLRTKSLSSPWWYFHLIGNVDRACQINGS